MNHLQEKALEYLLLKNEMRVGVLNLMGNVFMKKCEDVFDVAYKKIQNNKLKKDNFF